MLLDSTSSMMRTASSTFHCLIGSARRASYCGEPDPSVQLSPNGQSGSLYLLPTAANSNESSLSTGSYDEQRRTVTIYDGRVPSTPMAPHIPFELMTPIDAITQTIEDPMESFVQIVLEEPDDRPPVIRPHSSPRHRRRRNSSNPPVPTKKLGETQSMPVTELFNSLEIQCRAPDVVEPMDFSFLEPVLRGESAAPPATVRTSSLPSDSHRISPPNSSTGDDSSIALRPPSQSSHRIIILEDNLTPALSTVDLEPSPSCLKVPSSID